MIHQGNKIRVLTFHDKTVDMLQDSKSLCDITQNIKAYSRNTVTVTRFELGCRLADCMAHMGAVEYSFFELYYGEL